MPDDQPESLTDEERASHRSVSGYGIASAPSANHSLIAVRATTTLRAEVRLNTGRTLAMRNSASTAIYTTGALAANTWHRINWSYNTTTGKQQIQIFSGANVHGSTPDEDSGLVTTTSAGNVDRVAFGAINSTTVELFFDNFNLDTTTFMAPTGTPSNTPPTAS